MSKRKPVYIVTSVEDALSGIPVVSAFLFGMAFGMSVFLVSLLIVMAFS